MDVTLHHQPYPYSLFSGGGYCSGESGYEIKLEDSEIGVDYQLYKDGVASGALISGTGNMLSFGYQTVGTYTVTGFEQTCSGNMLGVSTIFIIDSPATAVQPSGPSSICNNVPSTFTAVLPANGFTLVWTLDPPAAGTISQPTLTTALVTWNQGFSGSAAVTVQGQNECGEGPASPAHTISVNPIPTPVVSGIVTVCKTQENTYSTTLNSGSTYAWAVTGGSITSGQVNNEINVVWGTPGIGSVMVTETSIEGCVGASPSVTVEINECTGIAENQTTAFNLYPNPATDQLNVVLNSVEKKSAKLTIYNHMGQVVCQAEEANTGNQAVQIDISGFSAGTYMLQIISGNEVFNKIFVKTK
jgi:hypothetical protein